uniref:Uncharacterized protein n=1 Tax=Caenorhabditis tropicalis TaxID=1561998 RepID=A0A1I7TJM9_9PELO
MLPVRISSWVFQTTKKNKTRKPRSIEFQIDSFCYKMLMLGVTPTRKNTGKYEIGGRGSTSNTKCFESTLFGRERKKNGRMNPHVRIAHYLQRSMRGGGDEQMKNFTEMTNEELRERLMKMQMDMQNLQMAMGGGGADGDGSNRNSANYATREEPSGRMDRRTEYESGGQRGQQEQLKQRSKSMPRSLRQLGVGKPFNVAAKQAKKEYIERRRTYSGSRDALNGRGRGTQFSEEVLSANAVKLPDNRF